DLKSRSRNRVRVRFSLPASFIKFPETISVSQEPFYMLDKYFQSCYYQIVNNKKLGTNPNLDMTHLETAKSYNISRVKHYVKETH
ncbi:MAG TPA: hypothetical protein P5136_07745, partial [Methanofastidiosum sp.]|nr:hypothetical protein [Methanofastidiosum sp.]